MNIQAYNTIVLGRIFKDFLLLLLLCMPLSGIAAETLGVVIRSQNMPGFPAGYEITENSEIQTRENQKIAVKTNSGDVLIANPNSTIKLVNPGFFQQLFGKIYYFINRRSSDNQVRVQTTTATIGIRGTKFVVDSAGDEQKQDTVSLAEGKLNFESNDDEYFKLYQQREIDEFEKFKQELAAEYDSYKKQMAEEFVAYKKSIDLEHGYSLSFDGKKVVKVPFDENMNLQFEEFEAFIKENTLE